MSRVKINLTNGNIIDKNLISAFKTNNGSYIVLDDERTGNMGLPVILVSKIDGNKATSVIDPNEWNAVKDNLRNIISGSQTEYFSPNTDFSGDDNYCSQLTLPVEYFNTLKNNYKPIDEDNGNADASLVRTEGAIEQGNQLASVAPVTPMSEAAAVNLDNYSASQIQTTPELNPEVPEMPSAPSIGVSPVSAIDQQPINQSSMSEVSNSPAPIPNNNPAISSVNTLDFSQDKEAFLKACENMFDALVSKFNGQ